MRAGSTPDGGDEEAPGEPIELDVRPDAPRDEDLERLVELDERT